MARKLIRYFIWQIMEGNFNIFFVIFRGPGTYLDGSGSKNGAKVAFRIGMWLDISPKTASEHFRKMGPKKANSFQKIHLHMSPQAKTIS